jgi:ADP-ribose pyrophosphatase YjhB (NUDIX family)
MKIVVTCRALIIHDNKLLMCQHSDPDHGFYNLPGGKLDAGETLDECMERELFEETGIKPVVGKILFINQFINVDNHRIEFFYRIENGADFIKIDPSKASHGFEIANFVLGDPTDPKYDIKPGFLVARFAQIVAEGSQFKTEVIVTN